MKFSDLLQGDYFIFKGDFELPLASNFGVNMYRKIGLDDIDLVNTKHRWGVVRIDHGSVSQATKEIFESEVIRIIS